METNKLDAACGMHGDEGKCIQVLGTEERILLKCIL